jgi:hypothetical protein
MADIRRQNGKNWTKILRPLSPVLRSCPEMADFVEKELAIGPSL